MSTNRYSLADYELAVEIPSSVATTLGVTDNVIIIGGPGSSPNTNDNLGSFVGTITVSRSNDLWSTEGDATGSWVHNKNLNRTGTCSVSLRQVSDKIITFAQLCTAYETIQDASAGLTLTVRATNGSGDIAVCNDCYITKMPDQNFGETAEMQTWTFTCGQVIYVGSKK